MTQLRTFTTGVVMAMLCSGAAAAQDSNRVVSLTLQYPANLRPNVIVPRLGFPAGDSVRAILQRDFKNGDRIDVMQNTDQIVLPASGAPDYTILQQLGATFLVQVDPSPGGIRVTLHEIGAKRIAGSKDFALAGIANSYDWRWALHGVSDVVQEWMTGERGIAQTRIAFSRGNAILVVDFDGANERTIERQELIMSPAWHPTQPALAFSAKVGSGWRIGMKPLSGGTTRWLTDDKDGSNMSPVFSPSGTELYYARQDDRGGDIWVVSIAGPLRRRITQGARIVSPTISPDGLSILYVNDAMGNAYLYLMGKDGVQPRTFIAPAQSGSKTYLESPSWSPDGNTVAYAARRGSDKLYQIETMDVRTKQPELRTSQGENEDPSWGPDSRHMVLVSNRTGSTQLWIFDTKTGATRQLTHTTSAIIKTPAWSPRPPEP